MLWFAMAKRDIITINAMFEYRGDVTSENIQK